MRTCSYVCARALACLLACGHECLCKPLGCGCRCGLVCAGRRAHVRVRVRVCGVHQSQEQRCGFGVVQVTRPIPEYGAPYSGASDSDRRRLGSAATRIGGDSDRQRLGSAATQIGGDSDRWRLGSVATRTSVDSDQRRLGSAATRGETHNAAAVVGVDEPEQRRDLPAGRARNRVRNRASWLL